jgi:hypothetical protein
MMAMLESGSKRARVHVPAASRESKAIMQASACLSASAGPRVMPTITDIARELGL